MIFKKRKDEPPKPILKAPVINMDRISKSLNRAGETISNSINQVVGGEEELPEFPENTESKQNEQDVGYKPEHFKNVPDENKESELFNLLYMIYLELRQLNGK